MIPVGRFSLHKGTLFCFGFSFSGSVHFQQVALESELPTEVTTTPSVPNNRTFLPTSLEASSLDDSLVDSVPVSMKLLTITISTENRIKPFIVIIIIIIIIIIINLVLFIPKLHPNHSHCL
jgi:hypothetical protein